MAFDLDDDELKATKIMNGTLKDEEEKDIKFIRKYMQDYFFEDIAIEDDFEFEKAIENLINKYKNLKEIEESHRKENGELRERVKGLEEENEDLRNIANNKQWISPCYVAQNYISKSKIKEKIEEYFEDEEWLVEHDLRALCDDEKECREYYTNKKIALKDIKKAILDKIDKLLKNY